MFTCRYLNESSVIPFNRLTKWNSSFLRRKSFLDLKHNNLILWSLFLHISITFGFEIFLNGTNLNLVAVASKDEDLHQMISINPLQLEHFSNRRKWLDTLLLVKFNGTERILEKESFRFYFTQNACISFEGKRMNEWMKTSTCILCIFFDFLTSK